VKSATTVLSEFPEPDQDQPNPYIAEEDVYRNQANSQYREKLTEIADEVLASSGDLTSFNDLTKTEQDQVAAWDQAIGWLTAAPENTSVTLPNLLTATNLMKVINSPTEVAQNLLRPLPTAPARVATSGNAVHAKIESYYKMATLIDLDELIADPPLPDKFVITAFSAFENSPYAKWRPIAVEWGFQLPIGTILISGRVDAVFEIDGVPVLVDWKTGNQKNADQMQLALYRLAWAMHQKLEIDQVKARFVFLPDLTEVEADQALTTEQVLDLVMKSINGGRDH
jgi:DNA helicase-2/ATP-dependent DNA helicase PcrA